MGGVLIIAGTGSVAGAQRSAKSAAAARVTITAPLTFAAPEDGKPKPNFSPKGMQVPLVDVSPQMVLPAGAQRPAKQGTLTVGGSKASWIPILATACDGHPADLCQLYIDHNRNGNFGDDGAALTTTPTQNEKTKAWWSSISKVTLSLTYGAKAAPQPYLVNFWAVREDSAAAPSMIRFSVNSWRTGTATINGVPALVAAMDSDNNGVFNKDDMWSVLSASAPDAAKAVLTLDEARVTNRLMFVNDGRADIPLEFRSFTADGSGIVFSIVPRAITKVADRRPDDQVREERTRPRTEAPVTWGTDLTAALAEAKRTGKQVLIDFEATWCGPCHTMDQWVWNDVDVAQRITSGFVGIKVDADLQKALVTRLKIVGYPTMMVMDADGKELRRIDGYQSSKQMMAFLAAPSTTAPSTPPATTSPNALASAQQRAPGECLREAVDWRSKAVAPALAAYRAATEANRAQRQTAYMAAVDSATKGSQQRAASCATQFQIATIPVAQIAPLAELYTFAGDTARARAAITELQRRPDAPPRARGQALVMQINQELNAAANVFALNENAEQLARQLDALPDSLNDLKLSAHQAMLGRYEYLDVAEGLYRHATAVIALARAKGATPMMLMGFTSLARSFADRLQPDSALKILDAGEKELGAIAVKEFSDVRSRYALIGTPAAAITAKWWLNSATPSPATPAPGVVTLVEFTAHWCGPCKNSYPGLISLAERFRGRAFAGVLVTQLYGYVGAKKNLSAEQEVAADREYFAKEHALPFPVAINAQIRQTANGFEQPQPDRDYRVGGIPQILIVDKKGVIRQIVIGWDQGNTARFATYIEQLLREP